MSSLVTRALRRLGRLLEPVLAPDAEAQRVRLEKLAEQSREQQRTIKALASDVTAYRADARKLLETSRDEAAQAQARLAELRTSVRRQDTALRRLARRN